MNIVILNGNPDDRSISFDAYLESLKAQLERDQHSVTILPLKQMNLKYCVGCFGCWVKTPGECVTPDDGPVLRQAIIASDLMIWASPLRMGYVSNLLKRAIDKSIPLLLPYSELVHGETHHTGRYERYPLTGLIYEQEADTDDADRQLLENMFARTSLNFRSRLTFCRDTSTPVAELAGMIAGADTVHKALPARPLATSGMRIHPPEHLTVFNGSPRGRKGNTPILLEKFLEGFQGGSARTHEIHDLIHIKQMAQFTAAFRRARCVLLAFPLYTDAMPGNVMAFLETLEQFKGLPDNPPMGFLVQSGFPESAHSRHVEQYLQKLCGRLGCTYLGTIVKGSVEGIQIQPGNMTRGLFDKIRMIGRVFSETGNLDANLLKQFSNPEQLSKTSRLLIKLLSKTKITGYYWDMQLRNNQAYDQRFAKTYSE